MSKVVRILIIAAVLIIAGVRVWRRRRRDASVEAGATPAEHPTSLLTGLKLPLPAAVQSDVALVAAREIRERTRGTAERLE